MHQNENLIDLLAVIYKWRKRIILFTLLAAISTAGLSLLMPNIYKATTVFYAASPDLAKPLPVGNNENDRDFYGKDTDLDRLFSIARSSELADYLTKTFNLYEHYDIDSSHLKGPFKLRSKLNKMLNYEKNKYDALELSVEDKDPEFAYKMANAARNKINDIAQYLIKESQKQLLDGFDTNLKNKEKSLDDLSKKLTSTKEKYKIYSVIAQGESYASALTKVKGKLQSTKAKLSVYKAAGGPQDSIIVLSAVEKGFQTQLNELEQNIKLFNEGFSEVYSLELEQKDIVKQLTLDKERYKQLSASYNAPFSSLHIVQEAEKPLAKFRPRRSLIVIGVAMLAFLLSTLLILLMHQYRNLNWKKIFE